MSARTKQVEMGVVSNLITDMTIRGANSSELARAVRHSMVVIDAEKHNLNYKQSALDNGIPQLKAKYQGGARSGASTLISRAGAEVRLPERKQGYRVDPISGRRVYQETGASYVDADGRTVIRTTRSKKLAETDDAHTLSSGTPVERAYADHSNKLKSLANTARKEAASTKSTPYSPSAKTAYKNEVATLDAKLNVALRNAPLERQAQVIGNAIFAQKKAANPDLESSEIKKLKAQALNEARNRTGAKKIRIEITDSEWAAIQAGAISSSKLNQILSNADLDQIKMLATPKTKVLMTSTKTQRALGMLASGYTQAEIADALGVSLTTLKTVLNE
jgi:ATP/maltotriose-dependent transcriptional regulator MalT